MGMPPGVNHPARRALVLLAVAAAAALALVPRGALRADEPKAPSVDATAPYLDPRLDFRGARARPRLAHDARGEDLADDEPGRRRSRGWACPRTTGGTRPARRGARGRRHGLPAGDRPGGHLRRAPDAARSRRVISDEARAKHHEFARQGKRGRYQGLTFWSPNINIFRDPRWGRGQETYGEDPYLTARLGVAFVKGLQGDDPRYFKVVATPKHYAVHSGPEPDRHDFDAAAERARPARDLPAGLRGAGAARAGPLR